MTDNIHRLQRCDWEVRKCSYREAANMVRLYHYSKGGSLTGTDFHGLYRRGSDEVMGVAWWLPPTKVAAMSVNPSDWKRVVALTRLVCHPDTPPNSASFLLGGSIRILKREGRWATLLTYADEFMGHLGQIYRATNWIYLGPSSPIPRWEDENGRQVAVKATKSRTKAQMESLGYRMVGKYRKHKFVMHLEHPAAVAA